MKKKQQYCKTKKNNYNILKQFKKKQMIKKKQNKKVNLKH